MKSSPRIMVFKLKELIYTGIFIVLGILLIILMVCMFKADDSSTNNISSSGEAQTMSKIEQTQHVTTITPTILETQTIEQVTTHVQQEARSEKATESQSAANILPTEINTQKNLEVSYIPGVYTSSLSLNNSSLELEVCVDANHINSVSIKNIDEAITTMYPLMANSVNDISNQIVNTQSLDNISYTDDCKYTYLILIDAIKTTLDKAKP